MLFEWLNLGMKTRRAMSLHSRRRDAMFGKKGTKRKDAAKIE